MTSPHNARLFSLLKEHFGFDSFRPHQEEIIAAIMARQDAFALLPTGGGKSLCYQLPAVAGRGLTMVISPLIALMKDQVDALTASGIPATFLNSSVSSGELRTRMSHLSGGKYKLLYVAPERLMQPAFLASLRQWAPELIAIDEAHCISEWGHDFRPEYRQLSQIRTHFPEAPVLALTATATERVRADIVAQLQLRNPRIFIGSFNRPNLSYRVIEKSSPYEQLFALIQERPRESGIVYCQSRKSAENLATRLCEDGVPALPYHAGLEPQARAKNQEAFIRDNVRVICATIAFGMGINKPNVRFVIHYDLPKNIEGYYQETGRAGRDSLPGDCILLFSAGDGVKLRRFIEDKPPREQEIARRQLDQIVNFAESAECRRAALLRYFGESYPETNCRSCDNCLNPKEKRDATVIAQKYLSCVYRIREKSGFPMGMAHVVNVLLGKNLEKVRRFGHDQLSTYGIGKEFQASTWNSIGRELIRLGLLRQVAESMNALELTPEGMKALKQRTPIFLASRPEESKPKSPAESDQYDSDLFEELRSLRKKLADDRAVPSYVIFSDVTLRQIAREYPADLAAFGKINGVGEQKRREFGGIFVRTVSDYLKTRPRREFTKEAAAAPRRGSVSLNDTERETLRAFRGGKRAPEIARARDLKLSTIYRHLEQAIMCGEEINIEEFASASEQNEIMAACHRMGSPTLTELKEHFQERFSYEVLRLVRAAHRPR
jgi:ATP-dependent DNA helicase RecQ